MNRDKAVVHLLVDEVIPGGDEINTNRHGEDATHAEQHHRDHDVLDAHHLVIGGELPVAGLTHVLTGVVHVICMAVIAAKEPSEWPIERTDAYPEANEPAETGECCHLVAEGTSGGIEREVRDQPEQIGEDDAGHNGSAEVLSSSQSATLRNLGGGVSFKCGGHTLLLGSLRLRSEPTVEVLCRHHETFGVHE